MIKLCRCQYFLPIPTEQDTINVTRGRRRWPVIALGTKRIRSACRPGCHPDRSCVAYHPENVWRSRQHDPVESDSPWRRAVAPYSRHGTRGHIADERPDLGKSFGGVQRLSLRCSPLWARKPNRCPPPPSPGLSPRQFAARNQSHVAPRSAIVWEDGRALDVTVAMYGIDTDDQWKFRFVTRPRSTAHPGSDVSYPTTRRQNRAISFLTAAWRISAGENRAERVRAQVLRLDGGNVSLDHLTDLLLQTQACHEIVNEPLGLCIHQADAVRSEAGSGRWATESSG